MSQKDVFLESEGDAWFDRNASAVSGRRLPEDDPLLVEMLALTNPGLEGARVLEVGCGEGSRLRWLQQERGCKCHGLDPSPRAVEATRQKGIAATVGTSESLPFADSAFDIVLFGFCLYLCDREDLFRIASEADRVLSSPGWLLILDFFSPTPNRREYHHRPGVFSYKMDYRTLFSWHPAYQVYSHKIGHHGRRTFTDDRNEWVATSVLRKNGSLND